MSNEIEGKVYKIMPEQTGESANGTWKKQEFVIETGGQFPKKICFNCWGDKTDMIAAISQGDRVVVSFEPQSREYNDKWFTDLRAWKIEKSQTTTVSKSGSSTREPIPDFEGELPPPPSEDDMPF